MGKKQLSERDICTKFITPALRSAGWDELTQLREEVSFTKGLNVGLIEHLPVPIPPLPEQRRIVAKVDELMALCDRLGASLTSGEAHRSRLLNALLAEALDENVGKDAVHKSA